MRVDKDGALAKSTYVTNLPVNYFRKAMESTVDDASWINVNNKRYNRIIHNIVIAGLIKINQHENNCCAA